MQKTWVLVADTTRARVFEVDKPMGPLQERETLVHVQGRLHEQELTSDRRPGRNAGGNGGAHSLGHEDDPKKQEGIRFAKQLGGYLEDAHNSHQFDKLYIVAAPSFLGDLRQNLGKSVQQAVTETVAKNVTRMEPVTIREHLPERL